MSKNPSLADVLFPTTEEEELEESILTIPPEQRRLHTETYDFSVSTLLDYLRDERMAIPPYQRREVWSLAQQSRLIESLIIQCPIPVLYLAQASQERLDVVDGNQRLTSIRKYVNNEFALTGLTAYPELSGVRYGDLDVRFQRHIGNRTLRCIVITKETHPQVKFDVFERLNSGAVKLTPQELRHGLYFGRLMTALDKFAKNAHWKTLIPKSFAKRMKSEELILRFLALHFELDKYQKPLAGFLNTFAERHRNPTQDREQEFEHVFGTTIHGVRDTYGDLAFKVFDEDLRPLSSFNAALFDAEMLSISRLQDQPQLTAAQKESFLADLAGSFRNDDFAKSIGRATSDESQVKIRVATVQRLLAKHL